uniref:Expressed conserved protein n=2 Tax=Echinococcus granulosus TaxID=6210 RepID=A0A068WKA5_ECHGR|nr:expressed conserved protein [Echinococcus granulosus]
MAEPTTEVIFPPQHMKKYPCHSVLMAEPTTEIVVSSQPVNKCSCSTTLKTEPTTEVTLSSQPVKECSCSSEVIISPKSLKEPLSCIEDDELLDGLQALLKIFLALK